MARANDKAQTLAREVRELRGLVRRLAVALYTHTRTDLAPDTALPQMRRLVAALTKPRPKGRKQKGL